MTATATADWNADDARRGGGKIPLGTRLAALFAGGKAALRDAGAEPTQGAEVARAANLAQGVARDLGSPAPEVWTYSGPPNALGVRVGRPVVALSTDLLATFARTEIEAVIAHLVVRMVRADRSDIIGYADDVRTVALTRFPPALASALEKTVPYEGRFAHHYFAAVAPSHRPLAERIAALQDI
ncbi:MAG TPA: hypothetical protein VG408_01700 [Actinomycetota bacterium]|nr:hypothetical protein [Actinomycetota bacterium]